MSQILSMECNKLNGINVEDIKDDKNTHYVDF